MVRFLLDGEVVTINSPDPTETVLEMLRYRLRRTGTKEGCAEGDCGACTVLVGELQGDAVVWRAVNACIMFLPMIDGRALLTVESLAKGGELHPVQKAMVELHGSQCGFCTPGFVMSLYGRSIGAAGTQELRTADVIAGNLCRCTGYGPILASGETVPVAERDDSETVQALREIARKYLLILESRDPLDGTRHRWFAPRSTEDLARLRVEHPDARIVAGATDVGLWVTKQGRKLDDVIWLGDVRDLGFIEETEDGLTIGAAARYSDAHAALARLHPDLGELVRRIGGLQVRNSGTIGGNIANGSPIGDTPPALIALGAKLTLRKGKARRTIPLEDFFIEYGRQDLQRGEFVESIFVPCPAPEMLVRIVKLSKRFASDITAVLGAFVITFEDGKVANARIAFGGMAGTPQRAAAAEAALTGAEWSGESVEAAASALAQDFTPMSDMRGSAEYRLLAAANLLRRLWIEQTNSGEDISVLEAEASHG